MGPWPAPQEGTWTPPHFGFGTSLYRLLCPVAAAAGIIARSGEQLAVFLAEKGVGMRDDGSGPVFDNAAFTEWLSPS